MEKKKYMKPGMEIVIVGSTHLICATTQVTSIKTNDIGLKLGNGTTNSSSGNARSRRLDWDDEDDELFLDW